MNFLGYLCSKKKVHRLFLFLDFIGHNDHGSTFVEFFSFFNSSGHVTGPFDFLVFLGYMNHIFRSEKSQISTSGFYRIY